MIQNKIESVRIADAIWCFSIGRRAGLGFGCFVIIVTKKGREGGRRMKKVKKVESVVALR